MNRRFYYVPIGFMYLIYFIALIYQNNLIGDLLSPILTFLACIPVFIMFYWKESHKLFRIAGLFYALSIFAWFGCDFLWGFSSLVLQVDPENSLLINNAYSLTNVFLFVSLCISAFLQIKNWNKMQIFLDTIMVSVSVAVIIWVFLFNQDTTMMTVLLNDPVSMISMVLDFIIFGWTSIWFFSLRNRYEPLFLKISAVGGLLFVVTDITYYYEYFYRSYEPNSLLDGGYVIAFTLMGVSGLLKLVESKRDKHTGLERQQTSFIRFKKELLFLLVPLLLIVCKGPQTPSLFFIVTVIMFYFIFTNYTQNSIYRDQILQREKEHVTELEQRVEERTKQIIKVMNTDIITGLRNRRFLEEYLEKQMQSLGRDAKLYLLYIDQNKYKLIKSIYGKYIAEKILEEVGKRIKLIMNEKNGLVTSYGEDIFVAVFRSVGTYEDAYHLAEKIVSFCSDNYLVESHKIGVTINIGISCYPDDARNMEELVRNADTAMFQARKTGFNVIRKYNHEIGTYLKKKDRIELKLNNVKYDDEFSLQFQPQVSCADGSICGVEALLRWYTKEGDHIPPMDFIPITEENGMIIPLGYWIMEQATKQLAKWKKDTNTSIKMAINVSTKQLLDYQFTDKLLHILKQYQIPNEDIEIEITENVQLENNTVIQEVFRKIRAEGIFIAIDDFGTGYSSLHYLRELPITKIKIAKELIDHINQDVYSKSIVQMVISVAKVKNIKVIAEGVETKEQWECLKQMECDEIQGFLFSKPLVPNELEKIWLNQKNEEAY